MMTQTKTCSTCKEEKLVEGFCISRRAKDGYKSQCKVCEKVYREVNKHVVRARNKRYYDANREQEIVRARTWQLTNPEKVKAYRQRLDVKARSSQSSMRYVRENLNGRIAARLRTRLVNALQGRVRSSISSVSDLGMPIEQFKLYLEKQFTPEMTWENYGSYWHIDHIMQLNRFDLTDPYQCAMACHYTNLRPLPASDNLRRPK